MGGTATRARSARPRWPRVTRQADRARCSFSSWSGFSSQPARCGCPRAAALGACGASAEGSAGRDAGCEAKAGQRARPPSGLRSYAYSGARQSAAQHSHSQRFFAALSSAFATALSPSLPALSASLSLRPRPSPLPSLALPLGVLSLSLLLSVLGPSALPSSLRSSNVSLSLSPAKRAACEQRARQSQTGVARAHVYGVAEPFFGPVSASCLSWCRSPCGPLSSCGPVGTNRDQVGRTMKSGPQDERLGRRQGRRATG